MKTLTFLALTIVGFFVYADVTGLDSRGEVRTEVDKKLLQNLPDFSDPFYVKFMPLHQASLQFPNGLKKSYYFPTLYKNVTTSIAMFLCDYQRAKALMPDPRLQPVHMGMGRAAVVITSYRYNEVYGIPGYNEVAIAIPVVAGTGSVPGTEALTTPGYPNAGFYIVSMPVTSIENLTRGKDFWGLNKVAQQIEESVEGDNFVTRVHEATGEVYLELRVPMKGDTLQDERASYIYSVLNGKVVRGKSVSHGTFFENSSILSVLNPIDGSPGANLQLGSTPSAEVLKYLKIGRAFNFRFATGVMSTFDLPEAGWRIR